MRAIDLGQKVIGVLPERQSTRQVHKAKNASDEALTLDFNMLKQDKDHASLIPRMLTLQIIL